MADLGSLYFDVLLRDKTAAERAKIKADLLRDLQIKLNVSVDTRTIIQQIRNDLAQNRFKIGIVVDKATTTQAVQQAIQQWKEAHGELAQLKEDHKAAKDAATDHASATKDLGDAMSSNLSIVERLGGAMASLFSIHLVKEFLSNVVEIGGELEHQKIAMDTIFGDKGKTIDLYGKVKSLARNSPFGVMELTQSVKALSAYGVEYNEIYETAKRLADISAATSVDINRLILAFGKTKSRTFLDGLEAKQFAYANIPIYDLLSKKLTELEGKFVSVKDVMGRIKKREIGFELVKEVLWDLTDEGGKFYNMQEALAGSVKTSWKLVKDNIELMYGELAESLAGPLKGTAELLQNLTRNWRQVATVMGVVMGLYGIFRLMSILTNAALGKETVALYQNVLAAKAKRAEKLQMYRISRGLTSAEIAELANVKKLTLAEFQLLMANKQLNYESITRLATMGLLNKGMVFHAVRCGELSVAEARAILTGKLWGMELGALGNKIKGVGFIIKDFLKSIVSLVTNPWNIAMGALSVFTTLWANDSQEKEKAAEAGKNIFTKAAEGVKNLTEALKGLNPSQGLGNLELTQGIEKMISTLKDYSPSPLHDINDALVDQNGCIRSLAEQYDVLRQKLEGLKEAYDRIKNFNIGDSFKEAINHTDEGWFNDNIESNAKDYGNALAKQKRGILDYLNKFPTEAEAMIETVKSLNPMYAKAISEMTTTEQKFTELMSNYYSRYYETINGDSELSIALGKGWARSAVWKRLGSLKTLLADEEKFWEYIVQEAKTHGVDLENASEEIKSAYAVAFKGWIEGLDVADEVKDQLYEFFGEKLNYSFERFDAESAFIEAFSKQSTELLGKELAEKIRNGLTITQDEWAKIDEAFKKIYHDLWENASLGQRQAMTDLILDESKLKLIIAKMNVAFDWPDWQQEINQQFGGDPQIQTWLKGKADMPSFIKAVQEGYKEAKEKLDTLKPLSLKAGVSLDFDKLEEIPMLSETFINADAIGQQVINEYNKEVRAIKAAKKAGEELGFNPDGESNKDKSRKDKMAERIKERINLLKNAYSEYKKWIELIGKDEAKNKVTESGLFNSLFSGKEPTDLDEYKNELTKLLTQLDDKTKERRELKVSIRKLLLDIDADEVKRAAEELKVKMENEISQITKQWDLYKQLRDAGADAKDAGEYAFGGAPEFSSNAEALRNDVENRLKEKGLEIPITISEDEAMNLMGGKDSPIYKQLFKPWKEAKDAIEKDSIEVKIREVTAINKYKSTAEKIADLNEKYGIHTGLDVGENGELQEKEGMAKGQRAMFREYQEKLAELKSELLTLLPVWGMIFGDHTYQSYGQIQKAAEYASQIIKNADVKFDSNNKPIGFTSWYTNEKGVKQEASGKYSELEKLKKAIDDLYKEGEKKNPFLTLKKVISEIFNPDTTKDKSNTERFAMLSLSAADCSDMIGDLAGQLGDMFDALGDEGMANAMNSVADVMNSISNIGQAFAKGGLIGGIAAAAGEAIGWVTKIFQAHDNKLQKTIEISQLASKRIQGTYDAIERRLKYHLGSGTTLEFIGYTADINKLDDLNEKITALKSQKQISLFDLATLSKYIEEVEKLQARKDAFKEGRVYGYQRQLLKEQLAELEKQRQAEIDKKKTNWDTVADYESQIDEMRVQIQQFAEETADTLYGINIKDWASQIGDALFNAWKRGEDGVKEFKKAVANLMGDVMNNILRVEILEPAMRNLETMLFGSDGMSGMFGKDFTLDERELETIGDYLMGLSEKSNDYYDMLDKLDRYMQSKYGITMKEEEDSSSGMKKGIQSVTENTADLLASYINAIRADVAMKREYVRLLIEELFPRYNLIAEAQLRQLEQIAKNTGRNADAAEGILSLINSNTKPGVGFKIA